MSKRKSIDVECRNCSGTGLYSGFCEPKGTAVICLGCDGTGCEEITYKEFTGRKGKRGIKVVATSKGRFLSTGVGPGKITISYKEFRAGKYPK